MVLPRFNFSLVFFLWHRCLLALWAFHTSKRSRYMLVLCSCILTIWKLLVIWSVSWSLWFLQETPTPTKHSVVSQSLSESRWSKLTVERHQVDISYSRGVLFCVNMLIIVVAIDRVCFLAIANAWNIFLQENYEFLSRCIQENMGFQDGKPVAACIIYKCLLHWHAFESERTTIFDHIIEGINSALKVKHFWC